MSATIEQINQAVDAWTAEEGKFAAGNKSAGTRARKALAELTKLAKQRRVEIQDAKNADAEAKAV